MQTHTFLSFLAILHHLWMSGPKERTLSLSPLNIRSQHNSLRTVQALAMWPLLNIHETLYYDHIVLSYNRVATVKFQQTIFNTHQTNLPHIYPLEKKKQQHSIILATTLAFKNSNWEFWAWNRIRTRANLCPLWEKQGIKWQIKCHFPTAGLVRKMNNLKRGYFVALISSVKRHGLSPFCSLHWLLTHCQQQQSTSKWSAPGRFSPLIWHSN